MVAAMEGRHTYSTDGVPAARSLQAWRQAMADVYYTLDIVPHDLGRVRGALTQSRLEAVGVSHFRADAQRVVRYAEAAKIDGSEDFVFLFPLREAMHFEQRGRTGTVVPGGVMLLNSAEDYSIRVPDGSENVTLKIRRDALRDRVKGIDARCAQTNIACAQLVPVVSQLAVQLLDLKPASRSLQLQDTVLDLLCLMLDLHGASGGASGPLATTQQPLARVMFDRLQAFIQRRLRDPALTPEKAAQAQRISIRYLHAIFQMHGMTFGRELMHARLQEARRLLSHAAAQGQARTNIGQIAFACGFSSQSHFSVRFRDRYGVSPRDFGRGPGADR
jgi:AraC-like DNA-binding protein